MKHVHHDMIVAWAADPSRVVEVESGGIGVWGEEYPHTTWNPYAKYRFKPEEPKYIVVNGVNVPEPVRLELEDAQLYWLASTSDGRPRQYRWDSTFGERCWLSLGLIHLTREAAQTHIDAMLLPSRIDK